MTDYLDTIPSEDTMVWASNQNLPKCILNPEVMMPIRIGRGQASLNQFRTFDTRGEALHSLKEEATQMDYGIQIKYIIEDISNSLTIKNSLYHLLVGLTITLFTWPIFKITQFRIRKMLKKSRLINPEWWL